MRAARHYERRARRQSAGYWRLITKVMLHNWEQGRSGICRISRKSNHRNQNAQLKRDPAS